jgi:UDP-glucose 4-epimerase
MMNILVTGGTGYIGSITVLALLNAGYTAVLLDNFANSKPAVLDRIERIAGQRPSFIQGDVRDRLLMTQVLRDFAIDAVIHFAGLKAVGDSVKLPLEYYDNNVYGTMTLLEAMRDTAVRTLVFSSSATVYRESHEMPLNEDAPTAPISPYGSSKLMVEQILADLSASDSEWSLTALRYFNPVGAHPSGLLGEDPQGVPNNLMPYIAQVAVGQRDKLRIFGDDYPTPDGTGVRDYIHVLDLAEGHLAALRYAHNRPGQHIFNLGTGKGHSVREMLKAFELACGRELTSEVVPRRPGDLAAYWADPTRAQQAFGWHAKHDLTSMCADTWRWQSMNPKGYDT